MNRRVVFFGGAAVVCLTLVPVLDPKFQWVPKALAALYAVLTLLAAADALSRRRS
ncbi:MAG TPA: hypothetical protein VFQ85_07665 [Mycobacteriales bacterium]|nr:hypothetical protein [Mycobacteriales bacterium]